MTRLLRRRLHVEEQVALRLLLDGAEELPDIEPPVRHGLLLGDGVDAVRRGGEGGAVGRDKAAFERAARLEHLGGEHEVDAAGARIEREERPAPAERRIRRRKNLDIVGCGAGALRDAGDRGRLHRQVGAHRRIDDPIGEHAAALAAQGGDKDGDRARSMPLARAAPEAGCSQAMNRPRIVASKRSQAFGFCTMSAR